MGKHPALLKKDPQKSPAPFRIAVKERAAKEWSPKGAHELNHMVTTHVL